MSFSFPSPSKMTQNLVEATNYLIQVKLDQVSDELKCKSTILDPNRFSIVWPECEHPYIEDQCMGIVGYELRRLGYEVEWQMVQSPRKIVLLVTIPSS